MACARCNEVSSWYLNLLGTVKRASWRRQQSFLEVVDRVPPDWAGSRPSLPPEWSELGLCKLSQLVYVDQMSHLGGTLGWFFTLGLYNILCLRARGICALLVFLVMSICFFSLAGIPRNTSACIESGCQCAYLLTADRNLLGEYSHFLSLLLFSGHLALV